MNSSNAQSVGRIEALKQEVLLAVEEGGIGCKRICAMLCDKWAESIESGSLEPLLHELDLLVLRLQSFQRKARIALPVRNGGLGGQDPEALRSRLRSLGLEVKQTDDGLYAFTGSGDVNDSEEEAMSAALVHHARCQMACITKAHQGEAV